MQYDYLELLCKERGISVAKLMDEIGSARSAAPRWKSKGYEPAPQAKKKIADYFGITVQELDDGEIKKPAATKGDELPEDAKRFFEIIKGLDKENLDLLTDQAELLLKRQRKT